MMGHNKDSRPDELRLIRAGVYIGGGGRLTRYVVIRLSPQEDKRWRGGLRPPLRYKVIPIRRIKPVAL